MADELDLDTLDVDLDKENKVEKRIKDLSEKVKLTAQERDELNRLGKEKDDKIVGLEKERDFLNSFGDSLTKFPEAAQFRDKIKEKVLKGYSMDDATVSILIAEGKYNPPKKEVIVENPAGGSAVTHPVNGGEKPLSELTRDEKRAKLLEAEQRGDLSVT